MNPVSKFTPKPRRERTYAKSSSDTSQEKKNSVQVFCRLRPLKNDEESTCIKLLSPTVLTLSTPAESRSIHKELQCHFKHIFTGFASQKELFEHVAYPLLEDLLHGKDGLLFTYGVTGSGKTHTLTGEHDNPGIMPKCIYTIFNTIAEYQARKFAIKSDRLNGFEVQSEDDIMQDKMAELRSASRTPRGLRKTPRDKIYINDGLKIQDINTHNLYSVFVTYIEIYNNTVYDLLEDTSNKTLQAKILREDAQKNMYVNGVVEVEVKTAEEAFEMFNAGQKRKRMGNTILNSESSRSHSIFNIRVVQLEQMCLNSEGQSVIPETNRLKVAQLSLVDLAGSERTNRTQNTGKLLKEASQINNSLMSLRSCLDTLRENQLTGQKKLVPYRDSRLTLLFKNHFEGEGTVRMIVCVNPSVGDFEENLHVMKFAEMTQDVKVTRTENNRYYTPIKKTINKRIATPLSSKTKVKTTSSFSLGPKIPEIRLNFNSPKECSLAVDKLLMCLRSRKQKKVNFEGELTLRETSFRKRLIGIHQENLLSKSELKSNRTLLKKEKQKSCNLETKMNDLESSNNDLVAKNEELHNIIRSLHNKLSEKDLKINKNILEKEKTKQKLALAKEKMTHELDSKLRRQRNHLEANAKADKSKIQKVIEILNKDGVSPPDEVFETLEREPLKEYVPPQQTPQRTTRRNLQQQPSARRRSRSAGEVWLEHNSVKPVPLGTVLQPSMKKRKSVTKLSKASDVTNPKQSKYCLIAQEADHEGEMETKVYKADIVPTCGGGAQVIFNDVERLRQTSPTRMSN